MNSQKSQELLEKLLTTFSTEGVQEILDNESFSDEDWRPYGGREKNWDTVSNQQSNAIGALTELITNSIDAVLSRRAYEEGIADLSSDDAPKSMQEAVRRFYKVDEGNLASLEARKRGDLAMKSILIGVKREKNRRHFPTITVVDFGEGQNPDKFEKTFLSLSETNKEGIGFVQGKFNMGSTGSIPFCTEGDITKGYYKLIASKRYDGDLWGWTLIRVSQVQEGHKLPIVEYLKPDGEIMSFKADAIKAFGHDKIGAINQGSIVRLFDYDIGDDAHQVDFGLYRALTLNLLDCALPVRIYDFDAKKDPNRGGMRAQGIADRTFSGMNVMLNEEFADDAPNQNPEIPHERPQKRTTEFVHMVAEKDDDELGTVSLTATGVSGLQDFLKNRKKRIFYTINGQTHATKNASFWNTVGLGDLQNHIIVNVKCENMDKTALTMFMGNREQKKDSRLSRKLDDWIKESLKSDKKLREYANIIRMRRVSERIDEDEDTKKLLSDLIQQDASLLQLLGLGTVATAPKQIPGGHQSWDQGKFFPTFLKPLTVQEENGVYIKDLPLSTNRKIRCGTDADDDYLTRSKSPGWFYCDSESSVNITKSLRHGIATFTFTPPSNAKIGDEISFNIGFQDYNPYNPDPLCFPMALRIVAEKPLTNNPSGERTNTRSKNKASIADPTEWVHKENWGEFGFDEKSGASVRVGDTIKIYVNHAHETLDTMRAKQSDKAVVAFNENRFRICLGFLTLAVYKFNQDDDAEKIEEQAEQASNAMAPYILSLISTLGDGKGL